MLMTKPLFEETHPERLVYFHRVSQQIHFVEIKLLNACSERVKPCMILGDYLLRVLFGKVTDLSKCWRP